MTQESPTARSKIKPIIVPRAEHTISREMISRNALKVLYRLHEGGYSAYLVGGCVRDLLLGERPKDFDIATDALPEDVRKLFKNCRLIGKRFRLAHILFGKDIIEVATFRTHHQNAEEHHGKTHQGMIVRDNVYGSIEDDVWRRDFSINALYYNIADFSVVDYTGGMADIKTKTLRIIGDPEQRFQEDPVRLLRAARFVGKLNTRVSPETESAMMRLSHLLENVSSARLFQEVLKIFQGGSTTAIFHQLEKYHLLKQLFPQTAACLTQSATRTLLLEALQSTDARTHEGKTVSPAFLLAVFLWYPIQQHTEQQQAQGLPPYAAFEKALQTILKLQSEQLSIPRILLVAVREICSLQYHLTHRYGSKPFRMLEHARFRAAYDLLLLRAKTDEPVQELAEWWTLFQNGDREQREALLKSVARTPRSKNYKRRSGGRKRLPRNKNQTS